MPIKKHDFIEIDYTGRFKDNTVFDTTDKKVAEENKIYDPKMEYKPGLVCVGEQNVPPGLDKFLEGKELNKEYKVDLKPEEAFGRKNAQLIKLVPLRAFAKEEIMPQPGLQVNIDNEVGIILRVSGGRVLVDFNHPFASKEVNYTVKVLRILIDTKEKIDAYLKLAFNLPGIKTEIKDNHAHITMPIELPQPIQEPIKKKIIELTGVKEITFLKSEKKAEPKKEPVKTETKPSASPKQ